MKTAFLTCFYCLASLQGATITVSNTSQLLTAVANANSGDTVLMSNGTYAIADTGSGIGLNINKAITVKSSNGSSAVTLTANTSYIAIQVNAANVTVDGITISGAQWGVQVTGYSGAVLRNLVVSTTGTGGHSLGLQGSTYSVIELCTANNAYNNGINISTGANYNLIVNNVIQGTQAGDGVAVVTSDRNIISGNTINNTYFDGVTLNGSQYNYVALNKINSPHNGVTVTRDSPPSGRQSIGNYIGNNSMVLNPSNGAGGSDGIWFNYDSNYNMAFGNDATASQENGMAIFNSVGNYVRANVFHQNPQGGIFVWNSNGSSGTTPPAYNSIQQNYLYRHAANGGVTLDTAPNIDISFNYMAGDPANISSPIAGLLIRTGVTNTSFVSNLVRDLRQGEQVDSSATGIALYLNRHLNTPNHYTFAGASVQWDSGSTALGGNYFSDFTTANGNPSNGSTPYTNIIQDQQGDEGLYKDNYPYQSESLGRPYLVSALLPSAGSALPAGSLKTISWASQGCVLVDLSLVGASTSTIASNTADYGYYRWTVPNVTAGSYSVRVDCKDSTGSPVRASSTSGQFTITPPDLVLLSPQSSQVLDTGGRMLVSWSKSANVTSPVDVYIRYGNANSFSLLQSAVTADFLNIAVPAANSNQVSVMIVSGAYSDSTDGAFSIRMNSTGTFTSPAASSSSTLLAGSAYSVEWVSPVSTAYVDIDLISGSTTKNIATQLADFGRYLMLVPALTNTGAYLRLTFHSASGTVLNTAQSAAFTLATGTGGPPTADSVSPASGAGAAQTFSAVYSDPSGYGLLNRRLFLINSSLNGASACFVQVDNTGTYLVNDAGSGLTGPLTGSNTLSNSQCTLNGSGTGVGNAGNSSTVTLSLTFKAAFAGAKTVYLYADDTSGNNSSWQSRGTYSITTAPVPSAVSVSPSSGSAGAQTFTAVFSDTAGASALNRRLLLLNSSLNGANACYVQADPSGIYLVNNAGNGLLGPLSGSNTVSNSQCTLNGTGTSLVNSGNTSTLTASLTFLPAFAGAKTVYLYTEDSVSNTGFQSRGTFTVAVASAPTAVSVSPSSGVGLSQTFTATYSDAAGAASLNRRLFLMNTSLNGASACFVQADSTGIYLVNDAGSGLLGPVTGSNTLSNTQCTLNGSGTALANNGTTSTLTLSLTFKPAFSGSKNVYLYADDSAGNNSNWQTLGAWAVGTSVPTTVSVSPSSGGGITQTFTAVYSDAAGAGVLNRRLFLVNTSLNGSNACFIQVDQSGIYLVNDNDSGLIGPIAPGASNGNTQCTLNGSGTGVSNSGANSTVTLNITFSSYFVGAKNIYMYADDTSGNNSGFQLKGTYNVTSAQSVPTPTSVTPNSGSGASRTFTAVYTDQASNSLLNRRLLLINSTLNGANACYIETDQNGIFLVSDSGAVLMGPLTQNGSQSNSQCTLSGTGASVGYSTTTTTVTLPLTFSPAFGGTRNIYMYADDTQGHNSGWQLMGTITTQ